MWAKYFTDVKKILFDVCFFRRKSSPLIVQEKRKLKSAKSSSSPSKLLLKRKRMSQLMSQENLTPEEKQLKREQMKAQEEIDKQVMKQ